MSNRPTSDDMQQVPDVDVVSIAAAAKAIFTRLDTSFTTSAGKVVHIQQAKTRHFSFAVNFFDALNERVDPERLFKLYKAFGEEQIKADMEKREISEERRVELVRAAFGNASILLTVLKGVSDHLPALVSVFTNLSVEEVDDLEVEDLLIVIGQIALVNYSFFTQTLQPILHAFGAGLLAKMQTVRR